MLKSGHTLDLLTWNPHKKIRTILKGKHLFPSSAVRPLQMAYYSLYVITTLIVM